MLTVCWLYGRRRRECLDARLVTRNAVPLQCYNWRCRCWRRTAFGGSRLWICDDLLPTRGGRRFGRTTWALWILTVSELCVCTRIVAMRVPLGTVWAFVRLRTRAVFHWKFFAAGSGRCVCVCVVAPRVPWGPFRVCFLCACAQRFARNVF